MSRRFWIYFYNPLYWVLYFPHQNISRGILLFPSNEKSLDFIQLLNFIYAVNQVGAPRVLSAFAHVEQLFLDLLEGGVNYAPLTPLILYRWNSPRGVIII